ncbi:TniQ family protein [Azospirillum sp. TSO22-1]|uniref:TniQ family protein n=1 Tax=Azospirillum sp. TSO22-1 TaxID=716789 RepID=UPI000D65E0AF|nr:TniQ family protein [Azospirillum sp. TSO22-1]
MRLAPHPFPVAPRPMDGELLSSWRARIACRYGLEGWELAPDVLSGRHSEGACQHDVDWAPAPQDIQFLAASTRLDVETVAAMALSRRGWRRHWACWERAPDDTTAWGPYGRVEVAWCPACLRHDRQIGRDAWLRRDWAIAARGLCATHGLPLEQRCHFCEGWQPQRWVTLSDSAVLLCSHCGRSLDEVVIDNDISSNGVTQPRTLHDWAKLRAFEEHLVAVLDGHEPDGRWTGRSTRQAFLCLVEDLTRLLCHLNMCNGGDWALINRIVQPPWPTGWRDRLRCSSAYPLAVVPIWWRRALLSAVARLLTETASERGYGFSWLEDVLPPRPLSIGTLYTELDDVGRRMLADRSSRWPVRPQAAALAAVRNAQKQASVTAQKKLQEWQAAAYRRQERERKSDLRRQRRERQRLIRILNNLFQATRHGPVSASLFSLVIGHPSAQPADNLPPTLGLRPASVYRDMAEDILRGPVWQASRQLDAKDRIKLLGRLARQALFDEPASPGPPA